MTNVGKEKEVNEITTNKHEVKILWRAVKNVLANNDISNPSDIGLLLELFSRVAEQFKDTNKDYVLRLEDKFLKPAWHCLNINLKEELFKIQDEFTVCIIMIEKIAPIIDGQTQMGISPLTLVKG